MYQKFFGLSDRPFQLTPDPRFWFESATHRKAMAYLSYGLAQGEGFIVITGDIGAGKTTLAGHLFNMIDPARVKALSIVSTQIAGDDMLRLVALNLGLETQGVEKAQLLDRIERALDDEARAGRHVLLVVDEAQNLPTSSLEELRMLSNYQVSGRSRLQIFMLGQPEFRDRLASEESLEQLRQRVIASHHLSPMDEDEIAPYIAYRMQAVGGDGRPSFSDEALKRIYEATAGLPRKLNLLMTRVLLHCAMEEVDHVDMTLLEDVLADEAEDKPFASVSSVARVLASVTSSQNATGLAEQALSPDVMARIAGLEARVEQQEIAIRRLLGLMIEWVEMGDRSKSAYDKSSAA